MIAMEMLKVFLGLYNALDPASKRYLSMQKHKHSTCDKVLREVLLSHSHTG